MADNISPVAQGQIMDSMKDLEGDGQAHLHNMQIPLANTFRRLERLFLGQHPDHPKYPVYLWYMRKRIPGGAEQMQMMYALSQYGANIPDGLHKISNIRKALIYRINPRSLAPQIKALLYKTLKKVWQERRGSPTPHTHQLVKNTLYDLYLKGEHVPEDQRKALRNRKGGKDDKRSIPENNIATPPASPLRQSTSSSAAGTRRLKLRKLKRSERVKAWEEGQIRLRDVIHGPKKLSRAYAAIKKSIRPKIFVEVAKGMMKAGMSRPVEDRLWRTIHKSSSASKNINDKRLSANTATSTKTSMRIDAARISCPFPGVEVFKGSAWIARHINHTFTR